MAEGTELLGSQIPQTGVQIRYEHRKAVVYWPKPRNIPELLSFLRLPQFFRRFIKGFPSLAATLTDRTRNQNVTSMWNYTCEYAFLFLKNKLVQSPIISPPNWTEPFRCHVDACQVSFGETLSQIDDNGQEWAIAYFSKRLSSAEENYSTNDREFLGLIYF